ncbi:MAG: type II secretion system protein GspL [Pseudomonadota bacterium]
MPEHLIVRLPADPDAAPEVLRVGEGGAGHPVEMVSPDELTSPPVEGTRVLALVPGEHVLHRVTSVPVKGTAKILATVPFALEEHIAEDVGTLHFAIGAREDTGDVPVAAVAADLMEQWTETLAELNLSAKAMFAESSLLHPPARTAVALIDGEHLQLAAHGHPPVVDQVDNLELLLDALGAGEDALTMPADEQNEDDDDDAEEDASNAARSAPSILTVFAGSEDLQRHAAMLDALERRLERVERRELTAGVAPLLAQQAAQEVEAINLLQGAYAPASHYGAVWREWRVAAVLAGILFLTVLGGKGAQLLQLRAEDARLTAQVSSAANQLCPGGITGVYSVQEELGRCLGDGAGPAEDELFLTMLDVLGSALRDTPNTRIEEVRFARQKMDLKLLAPSVDTLDEIKRMVADRGGINLEIEQVNPQADEVEFRIELTRPNA